jgi:HK97 gp10 family phage protein
MAKDLIEIQGFNELSAKIKQLPDKVKRSELLKILGQVANPTVAAARGFAPQSKKAHVISGSRTRKIIQPGNLKKSIGKIVAKRNRVDAVLVVGPRAKGKHDGWYGAFVNSGTVKQQANPFMDKAYSATKGKVTADAEAKVSKYVQKQIDRLSR